MGLIAAGVVATVTWISYSLWRRTRRGRAIEAGRARLRLAAGEPQLTTLRSGDVITHVGTDYLVEGLIALDDDGRVTRLYRITDAGQVRWLCVRPGPEEPLLLDAVSGLVEGGTAHSAPEQLRHHGAPYRLVARAMVRVHQSGVLGRQGAAPVADRAWLSEYAGAGARRILAIGWSERSETFAGESVARGLLEILPGT